MFITFCYHFLFLLYVLFLFRLIIKKPYTSLRDFFNLAICGASAAFVSAVFVGMILTGKPDANLAFHTLAWHGSIFLFVSAFLMNRQKHNEKPRRLFPAAVFLFGCIYCGLAVDALFIEPFALTVRETTIVTPKITKPLKIVFCTDIQVDRVGNYERRTLQKIKEINADLILFGGDYVQGRTAAVHQQLVKDLNQLFKEVDLQAPLGLYAVLGNLDWYGYPYWQEIFDATNIVPKKQTVSESVGEIRLTFLSPDASFRKKQIVDDNAEGKFRIIIGHAPVFSMREQDADLLLAGHTHGGQVQVPGFGALLTLSGDLPRRWASGLTRLPNETTLIVSNGSGLERGKAPRVRFWCRPDFWVIHLIPVNSRG
ncbi:MAG: metallophosphoesterase [Planctomycetaceae bacterium]|nr:metallophosphoesterase [Planctomycetaceae bacterium]